MGEITEEPMINAESKLSGMTLTQMLYDLERNVAGNAAKGLRHSLGYRREQGAGIEKLCCSISR